MKKLETKKYDKNERPTEPVKTEPVTTPIDVPTETPKPEPVPVKSKQDYTWVWILVGLLSAMAVVYFMNISGNVNKSENGNPEPKQ